MPIQNQDRNWHQIQTNPVAKDFDYSWRSNPTRRILCRSLSKESKDSLSLLERSEYADIILQQILQDHKDSLKIKEGVTSAYQKDKPQLAINLFKECYNTNKQRQKNLVRLGYFVSLSIWKRSRNLANLELSIKYQIEVVGKEDNSKIFDLTFLAGILLQKYLRHTKNNKIKNDLKKINSKIAKELKKKKSIKYKLWNPSMLHGCRIQ